jgi:hypothetical protein
MSGFYGDLSVQQNLALDQLKSKFIASLDSLDLQPADVTIWNVDLNAMRDGVATPGQQRVLLKFLRAREWNVDQALEQLKKTLEWRRDFDMTSLMDEEFSHAFSQLGRVYGKDRTGHPVTWNYYATIDSVEIFKKYNGPDAFIRWRFQLMERAIGQIDLEDPDPKAVETITQIHEYKGVSFFAVDSNVRTASKRIVQMFQDYYPEFLHVKLFLNIPTFLEFLYKLFSSLSSSKTRAKFRMLGPSNSKTELQALLDNDNLPIEYGGTGNPAIQV